MAARGPLEEGDTERSLSTSSAESTSWYQSLPTVELSRSFQEDVASNIAVDLLTCATLAKSCEFGPEIFAGIMDNLLRNPNITSSHLFRADLFYDSDRDATFSSNDSSLNGCHSNFVKHMRKELQPRQMHIEEFEVRRVLVRQLVPRNPLLDRELVQTCYFLKAKNDSKLDTDGASPSVINPGSGNETLERNLVVYVPHVDSEDQIPWYHPKVRLLAFLHHWRSNSVPASFEDNASVAQSRRRSDNSKSRGSGEISIHLAPFQSTIDGIAAVSESMSTVRLTRTIQNLLRTIARHGAAQLAGYKKRVHHDLIIPQARLQDTFTRLKQTHAKRILNEYWQETTDSTKGVFEDLGIAAFLIELWRDMYGTSPNDSNNNKRPSFQGFVDIGCGNGVLVYILLSEGYAGYGFDARRRKTWSAFPQSVQDHLHQQILVSDVLSLESEYLTSSTFPNKHEAAPQEMASSGAAQLPKQTNLHSGRFVPGTFIVSNHADELSPWTPLLALRSACPFICIPCCSHDLTGARHRFAPSFVQRDLEKTDSATCDGQPKQQQPSAYATLTAYIAHLARETGYEVEREALRIPSTRNVCIIGRRRGEGFVEMEGNIAAVSQVLEIVERETALSLAAVREIWCARASKIAGSVGADLSA